MSMERTFWKITRWARAGRFWLFLVLAALAFLGIGEANAQATDTREQAWEKCESRRAAYDAVNPTLEHFCEDQESLKRVGLFRRISSTNNTLLEGFAYFGCPPDTVWNPETRKCAMGCANRDPLGSHSARGSMTVCSDGCQYEQGQGVCIGSGTTAYCYAKEWHPTGAQCSAGDAVPNPHDPNNDTCRSTGGGWNECVKPNGEHCVTGPAGTRMCWTPGETGTKNDGSGKEWGNRQPEGNPTPPPPNIENPSQDTSTADKGGVSGDGVGGSFVIGAGSGTGNSGGQHNTGSGGSGNGAGSGQEGDGDGDHGAPGAVGGDLYEGSDKTVASVASAFKTRIEAAPIAAAASGFFSAPSGGGSCPIWTVPANEYLPAMTFDFFCMSQLQTLMNLAGWLILAIAGYKAFHIAIGD